ncbi:FAD:protein FMN transferase [bacterium]|jgi:FAD:protein FMN transferase|nr:FAD:protein FMN transferase [bacterium]
MEKPKIPLRQVLFLCLLVVVLFSYFPDKKEAYVFLQGKTMGTWYRVKFLPVDTVSQPEWKKEVDLLLASINQSMSTYIKDSEISRWNSVQSTLPQEVSKEFYRLVSNSVAFSQSTTGIFDITVGTLVNLWGFGPLETALRPSNEALLEALSLTGYQMLELSKPSSLRKRKPGVQIDLSSIAKGYGVDQVGLFLQRHQVDNYLVEIGGEIRLQGHSPSGHPWKVGINRPVPEAPLDDLVEAVELEDESLATSGNYRNYHQDQQGRWSHFIDPQSGMPRKSDLLSATVIAKDCETADALATIAILLGSQSAKEYLSRRQVDYLLIRGTPSGFELVSNEGWNARRI